MNKTHVSQLLEDIESFQNLLVSVATGGAYDDAVYKELREKLTQEAIISSHLPRFVHTCRDLA